MITDLQGKVILRTDRQLDDGYHSFRFHPGGGNIYFLTAYWNGMSRSIRMISTGRQNDKSCRLDYLGSLSGEPILKNSLHANDFFVRQSGILDDPEESQSYTFQFATNIPCPGMPTVEYEGQVYNTIQIFSQCWLKENLNVGVMTAGTDLFGFSGLPGGLRYYDGDFYDIGISGHWWSSSVGGNGPWYRFVWHGYPVVYKYGGSDGYGFSVRCLMDY